MLLVPIMLRLVCHPCLANAASRDAQKKTNKDRVPIHVVLMSLYNEIGRDKILCSEESASHLCPDYMKKPTTK